MLHIVVNIGPGTPVCFTANQIQGKADKSTKFKYTARTADIYYCPAPCIPPSETGFKRRRMVCNLRKYERWYMQTIKSKVEVRHFDGGILISLQDATISGYRQVEGLKREILDILENEQARRIVLDFANVRFFTTPFFSLIIKIRQKAGHLEFCNLNRNVMELLEVTNLSKIFPICKSPL